MIVDMDAAMYVPGSCNENWKRNSDGLDAPQTEIIDGVEYPLLPAGLMGW